MSATRKQFEKDGKKFATLELKKDGASEKDFGFTFGVGKARLILANLDAIQQFVDDNTGGKSE